MKNRILAPSNNWATPVDLYDKLHERFNFNGFDPCPIDCDLNQFNGLIAPWPVGNIFCNPSYDLEGKTAFSEKTAFHFFTGKCESAVLLLPVSTSTKLFHEFFLPNKATIEFIQGRIPFEGIDTKGTWCNPMKGRNMDAWRDKNLRIGQAGVNRSGQFDSMLVIFGDPKK
jgi:hypothetical protein